MLEWVAISLSRGSFYPVIKPMSPAFTGRLFSGYQGNPVRWNRRDKMLPVKVENKYRNFFLNRRKQIGKVLQEKKPSTASYASHTTYQFLLYLDYF